MKSYSLFLRIVCRTEEAEELKNSLTIPNASYQERPPRGERPGQFVCDFLGPNNLDIANLDEALLRLRNALHDHERELASLKWDKTLWCACFSDNSFETTILLDFETVAWLQRINASVQVTTYRSEEE
jgi:hypothetical protein